MRIGLHDFHPPLNDEQHVIVNIALADDHLRRFGTVDLHETGQSLHIVAGEVREEFRVADHVEDLLRERGPLSQVFEGVQKHVLRLLEVGVSHDHWKSGSEFLAPALPNLPRPERVQSIMRELPQRVKPDALRLPWPVSGGHTTPVAPRQLDTLEAGLAGNRDVGEEVG